MANSIFVVCFLMSSIAFADHSMSEFYFRPHGGGFATDLSYQSLDSTRTTTPGNVDTRTTTSDFNLSLMYGVSNTLAVGLSTFTGTLKTDPAGTDKKGLGDIQLFMKGSADMLYYGFGMGVSPGKADSDKRYTGGFSAKTNLGILGSSGVFNYGADLSYLMPLERTTVATPEDSKTTGGSTLAFTPFTEMNYGMGFLGAYASFLSKAKQTVKTGSTSSESDTVNSTKLGLFATYEMTSMLFLTADYSLEMFPSVTGFRAFTVSTYDVGVRLIF